MKARLLTAVTLGAMLATAGSAFAMSLQNERAHDGGPQSFRATVSGGQNLVLPYAADSRIVDVTGPVIAPAAKAGTFSLQNERDHDGSPRSFN